MSERMGTMVLGLLCLIMIIILGFVCAEYTNKLELPQSSCTIFYDIDSLYVYGTSEKLDSVVIVSGDDAWFKQTIK